MSHRIPKIAAVALLLLAPLALTGCDSTASGVNAGTTQESSPRVTTTQDTQPASDPKLSERHKTLNDGRTVVCVAYEDYSFGGGLSCDWAGAK